MGPFICKQGDGNTFAEYLLVQQTLNLGDSNISREQQTLSVRTGLKGQLRLVQLHMIPVDLPPSSTLPAVIV